MNFVNARSGRATADLVFAEVGATAKIVKRRASNAADNGRKRLAQVADANESIMFSFRPKFMPPDRVNVDEAPQGDKKSFTRGS